MLGLLLDRDTGAADAFVPGLYRWDRRGHVPVPARVWFGPPADPVTGEALERSWRWQFEFAGLALEQYAAMVGYTPESVLDSFWPKCRDSVIEKPDYDFLLDTIRYARAHEPLSPFADARGKVNLDELPIPDIGGS